MRRALALILLVSFVGLVAAACGGEEDDPGTAAPVTSEPADTGAVTEAEPDPCDPESLEVVNAGRLTIGTDNPAYPPWFEGGSESDDWELNDPATGAGYESAVAYLVAEQLGFLEDQVDWIAVPFNQIFRPGAKSFDFAINQVSYTSKRDQAVDFSASYYDANQAVVSVAGSSIEGATTVADLADARLGAPVGTTSYQTIVDVVQPSKEPRVYDDLNAAVSALNAGQVDGVVVDLHQRRPGRRRHHRRPVPRRRRAGVLRARHRGRQPAARLPRRGALVAPRVGRARRRARGVARRQGERSVPRLTTAPQ
jgi:polar amino acid transport system substrate-binding protein